jgi:hypothetical protein
MSEQEDKQAKKPRLNLTMTQVAASALAACCASIVASYLGVAGTVIGAAVGSVVATTGAAVWGHLFRTGGDKIKQTLLVNGQQVEVEVDRDDPVNEATIPAGRFYGAQANAATRTVDLWHPKTPTGETRVITGEPEDSDGSARTEAARTKAGASSIGARIVRIKKYRKPMGIAAAIIAVFCVSIVVGVIAGAPVRSAGSSSPPATVTTTTTVTDPGHTQGGSGDGSSASASSSASSGSGGTPSATATSPSSAASPSPAGSTASPTASPSAGSTSTGQALSGATSTGPPTS